jgi:hypothetical protein
MTSFLFLQFCKTLLALRRSSIGVVNLGVATFFLQVITLLKRYNQEFYV